MAILDRGILGGGRNAVGTTVMSRRAVAPHPSVRAEPTPDNGAP